MLPELPRGDSEVVVGQAQATDPDEPVTLEAFISACGMCDGQLGDGCTDMDLSALALNDVDGGSTKQSCHRPPDTLCAAGEVTGEAVSGPICEELGTAQFAEPITYADSARDEGAARDLEPHVFSMCTPPGTPSDPETELDPDLDELENDSGSLAGDSVTGPDTDDWQYEMQFELFNNLRHDRASEWMARIEQSQQESARSVKTARHLERENAELRRQMQRLNAELAKTKHALRQHLAEGEHRHVLGPRGWVRVA